MIYNVRVERIEYFSQIVEVETDETDQETIRQLAVDQACWTGEVCNAANEDAFILQGK